MRHVTVSSQFCFSLGTTAIFQSALIQKSRCNFLQGKYLDQLVFVFVSTAQTANLDDIRTSVKLSSTALVDIAIASQSVRC